MRTSFGVVGRGRARPSGHVTARLARRTWSLAAAALAVLAILAPGSAGATVYYLSATIDGTQETPPNASPATGSGTFTLDTVADTMSFSITFSGLTGSESGAHIHGPAPAGTPAGILFGLPAGSPKTGTWSGASLNTNESNIISGLTYVNIHSSSFGGGEIRGQILVTGSCGDGVVQGPEGCDDGNTTAGDGCSATCTVETCFTCTGTAPSVCSPITACTNGDGCCPTGCNAGNDAECVVPVPGITPLGWLLLAALLTLTAAWALRRRGELRQRG
jgi:cysteine-rich repeat protein